MYEIFFKNKEEWNPLYRVNVDNMSLLDPKLTLADNSSGMLEFQFTAYHKYYNSLFPLKTLVKVVQDDEILFIGRVISEEEQFDKSKTVVCEGALNFLLDTIQKPHYYEGTSVRRFLESLISIHNSQRGVHKFRVGAITVNAKEGTMRKWTNYENTLTCIKEKLIKSYGGHIRIREENGVFILDYLEDFPNTSTQKIEFGYNLLDYTKNINTSDICTAVTPIGATIEKKENEATEVQNIPDRVDIKSVNNGSRTLVLQEAVEKYGYIEKVVTFDNVHVPKILKTKGEEYLRYSQFLAMGLEIKAVDLNLLNPNIKPIRLLDEIIAISEPHSLKERFAVTKLTLCLDNPAQNTYILGSDISVSLTARSAEANQAIKDAIDNLPSESEILRSARENASELIKTATTGHVVTRPDEILIMDTNDIKTAKKVWRWNAGGLGYFKNGYNPDRNDNLPLTAITMDGQIVGERIVGGSITGEKLDIQYKSGVTEAIKQAESKAKEHTNEQLQNYYTSRQTETRIKNSADEIKLYAQEKAEGLVNNAIVNYYSKAEIDVKTNSITSSVSEIKGSLNSKVSGKEVKSIIKQSADEIKFAFNQLSQSMKIGSNGRGGIGLGIYNNGTSASDLVTSFNEQGIHFYRSNSYLGKIGSNNIYGSPSTKGIVFDMDSGCSYMAWASKNESDSNYILKMTYVRKPWSDGVHTRRNTLYLECPVVFTNSILTYDGRSYHRGESASKRIRLQKADGTGYYDCSVVNGVITQFN